MNKEIENQVVIYQDENGAVNVEVKIVEVTVWLSLNQIAALLARDKSGISRHLKKENWKKKQLLHFCNSSNRRRA
ncbi:MAG: hypothetical protein O7C59_09335 [Rickettsia endosymbiont of Ixodes persulcatus]|nr:hypothetical protein [Rickettsia endosymbiont of Ixodes persulcatus]MCZ6908516.1 hypothetical protein [Rickettsia endosymbiont of Ixodes persulcatus]MCZ6911026.1 hypothetical protein [Rickettsia endosymbiont of Ixodes persulcatus]MCZ6914629.1 hypothetical protein [Rickettsia endosymbiont of Ixodes persulcatus]MCZ6924347.1 hypothetical protein [Rickettsia endosymbiont of Ixodes persulcatus]